jgi:hypothetical protein
MNSVSVCLLSCCTCGCCTFIDLYSIGQGRVINKLLLCNYKPSRVYIYKDCKTYEDEISFTSGPYCITVVPCTDKAVVTLPCELSIQFINTTNNTKHNKIKIGEVCEGVTAVKDKIYIGGFNKVIILNTDGSRVREMWQPCVLNRIVCHVLD